MPDRRTASIAVGLVLAAVVGAALSLHEPVLHDEPVTLHDTQRPNSHATRDNARAASAPAPLGVASTRSAPIGPDAWAHSDNPNIALPDRPADPGRVESRGRNDGEADWPPMAVNPNVELTDEETLDELDRLLAEEAEFDDEYFDDYDDWDADVEDEIYGDAGDADVVDGPGVPLDDGDTDLLPTGFASEQILAGYSTTSEDAEPFESNLGENAAPTEALVSALVDDHLSLEVDPVELAAQAKFEGLSTPHSTALPPEVAADSHPPAD